MKKAIAEASYPVHGVKKHLGNEIEAEKIINKYTAIASGTGLLPLPILDLIALTGVQLKMLHSLGKLYDYNFEDHRVKSIIGVLTASIPANALIKTTSSIMKVVPFVGSLLGGVSGYLYAAASTYALGKVFKLHFATGLSLLSLDLDKMKEAFQEYHSDYVTTNTAAVTPAK